MSRTEGQHRGVGPAAAGEAQSLRVRDIRQGGRRTAREGVCEHSQELAQAGVNLHRRKTCFCVFWV